MLQCLEQIWPDRKVGCETFRIIYFHGERRVARDPIVEKCFVGLGFIELRRFVPQGTACQGTCKCVSDGTLTYGEYSNIIKFRRPIVMNIE